LEGEQQQKGEQQMRKASIVKQSTWKLNNEQLKDDQQVNSIKLNHILEA
jgi:hypothetical protein